MLEVLPEKIKNALKYLNFKEVYELRLRVDKHVRVNYRGRYEFLGEYGIVDSAKNALTVDVDDVSQIVYAAGNFSVYSVEEQLKKGFLTTSSGARIGLAGEFVFDKGQAVTARNFTSLCIRVPHEVDGAGLKIYNACFLDGIKNVLISSPPGQGKTTILRDLCKHISQKTLKNVLVCDERAEIGVRSIGETVDVYTYADKATAFECGIRAMRPDIIVCDELSHNDCLAVRKAIDGGVKVIASAHLSGVSALKEPFLTLFERFVFLSAEKIGEVVGVYDSELRRLQ